MTDQHSQIDHTSARWHELERHMLTLEARMGERDIQCCTGSSAWIEGLHRRHSGHAFPKDRVR